MIGQTLAHYKIVEKIGAGGMGEVYLAELVKGKTLDETFGKRGARYKNSELWSVNVKSSGTTPVAADNASQSPWPPNGHRIAYYVSG